MATHINNQTISNTTVSPNVNYLITYTANRTSVSKVKYTFTITPSMPNTSSRLGTGYVLNCTITVAGISAAGVLKNTSTSWSGTGPFTTLTLSVECLESVGNTNQIVTFKVDQTGTYDSDSTVGEVSTGSYYVISPAQYKLTINYNANGGVVTSTAYSLTENMVYKGTTKVATAGYYNNSINLYDDTTFGLTRAGYTFGGWQTSASAGTVFSKSDNYTVSEFVSDISENITLTLYAKWIANTLNLSFNVSGGDITTPTGSSGQYEWSLDSEGNIYKNGTLHIQQYVYGSSGSTTGLPNGNNASYMCLLPPDNYTFLSGTVEVNGVTYNTGYWSSQSDGMGVILDWDTAYTTDEICSMLGISLQDGSKDVTLYIVWALTGHMYVNLNGEYVSGILYVNIDGEWKMADTLYIKDSSGNFKKSII